MLPFPRLLSYGNISKVTISKIAAGGQFFLMLDSIGRLWGCGANTLYQFGISNDNTNYYGTWKLIMNDVKNVWAGNQYSMIQKTDNTIWYTGTGGTSNTNVPGYTQLTSTQMGSVPFSSIREIYCNNGIIHFVTTNEAIYALGVNSAGQAGNGGVGALSTLTLINGMNNSVSNPVQYIRHTNSVSSSFVLMQDGSVYTFGANSYGEQSKGNQNASYTPTLFSTFKYNAVCTGSNGVVLINSTNNFIQVCGGQYYGQLGTNVTSGSAPLLLTATTLSTTAIKTGTLVSPQRGQASWNNAFMNSQGIWYTGINPGILGAPANTTVGVFTMVDSPVPVDDVYMYGTAGQGSIVCTESEMYQCGYGTLIIGKGDENWYFGFTKVDLPWD